MAMAFFGHMGVEWNLRKESDEALNKLGEWVAEYKRHRAWFAIDTCVHADIADPAVRVDEQGACALRADVARQHQRFAQDDSLLSFIFALDAKKSFRSVLEDAARGDDIHAEAEHVRDHDIAAADTL